MHRHVYSTSPVPPLHSVTGHCLTLSIINCVSLCMLTAAILRIKAGIVQADRERSEEAPGWQWHSKNVQGACSTTRLPWQSISFQLWSSCGFEASVFARNSCSHSGNRYNSCAFNITGIHAASTNITAY